MQSSNVVENDTSNNLSSKELPPIGVSLLRDIARI